jgi:hypothetical protein
MKFFLNLTNGLDWLPSFSPAQVNFCRLTYTAIEKKDWFELFSSLDHNLLMRLAMGESCRIYDCGCRRPTSKVISLGVPIIRGELERIWCDDPPPKTCLPSVDERRLADEVHDTLFMYNGNANSIRTLKRRLLYYRKLFRIESVRLEGESKETEHDGDVEYFRDLLQTYYRSKGLQISESPVVAPHDPLAKFGPPLVPYRTED